MHLHSTSTFQHSLILGWH